MWPRATREGAASAVSGRQFVLLHGEQFLDRYPDLRAAVKHRPGAAVLEVRKGELVRLGGQRHVSDLLNQDLGVGRVEVELDELPHRVHVVDRLLADVDEDRTGQGLVAAVPRGFDARRDGVAAVWRLDRYRLQLVLVLDVVRETEEAERVLI